MDYKTHPNGRLEEIPPTHCPNGHKLGPGRVLVGWSTGTYGDGPEGRTWRCKECDAVIYDGA